LTIKMPRETERSDLLPSLLAKALANWSVDALFLSIDDPSEAVREAIARQLHVRGTSEVFDRALKLAHDEDPTKREMSAFILSQLGSPERPFAANSVPILLALCEDQYKDVRAAAAAAFGSLLPRQSPDEVVARLLKMSEDDSPKVRAGVAFSLIMFSPDERTDAALEKLREDEDKTVRYFASPD